MNALTNWLSIQQQGSEATDLRVGRVPGYDLGLAEAVRAEMHRLGISLGAGQSLAMLVSGTMIG
jgi:hypothetical protein